jgi:hypothetical protein
MIRVTRLGTREQDCWQMALFGRYFFYKRSSPLRFLWLAKKKAARLSPLRSGDPQILLHCIQVKVALAVASHSIGTEVIDIVAFIWCNENTLRDGDNSKVKTKGFDACLFDAARASNPIDLGY